MRLSIQKIGAYVERMASSLVRDVVELLKVRAVRWSVFIGVVLGLTVGIGGLVFISGRSFVRTVVPETPPVNAGVLQPPSAPADLAIEQPVENATVPVTKNGDGSGAFPVRGTAPAATAGTTVYLLLKPEFPAAREWWVQPEVTLQRGHWTGVAYIGNAQYPPQTGNRYALVAVVARQGIPNGQSFLSLQAVSSAAESNIVHVTAGEIR